MAYSTYINLNDSVVEITVPKYLCVFRHLNSWFNHHRMLSKEYPDIMSIFFGNHQWDKDIQLSNEGKIQGVLLANYWQNELNTANHYSKFISSSYQRCQDTIKFLTADYSRNDLIVEKYAGQYYGYSQAQLKSVFPDFDELKKNRWELKVGPTVGEDDLYSESYETLVTTRLFNFLHFIGTQNVAICTHGEVLTGLRYMIEAKKGVSFNEFIIDTIGSNYAQNGEIIEYDFEHRLTRNHRILKDGFGDANYFASQWNNF